MSYRYEWDSENKKKRYAGKYPDANPRGRGYFKRNDAGDKQEFKPKDSGTKVGFKGSNTKEYTFSNPKYGTHTITAQSFPEALRKAKTLGFVRSDYKKR